MPAIVTQKQRLAYKLALAREILKGLRPGESVQEAVLRFQRTFILRRAGIDYDEDAERTELKRKTILLEQRLDQKELEILKLKDASKSAVAETAAVASQTQMKDNKKGKKKAGPVEVEGGAWFAINLLRPSFSPMRVPRAAADAYTDTQESTLPPKKKAKKATVAPTTPARSLSEEIPKLPFSARFGLERLESLLNESRTTVECTLDVLHLFRDLQIRSIDKLQDICVSDIAAENTETYITKKITLILRSVTHALRPLVSLESTLNSQYNHKRDDVRSLSRVVLAALRMGARALDARPFSASTEDRKREAVQSILCEVAELVSLLVCSFITASTEMYASSAKSQCKTTQAVRKLDIRQQDARAEMSALLASLSSLTTTNKIVLNRLPSPSLDRLSAAILPLIQYAAIKEIQSVLRRVTDITDTTRQLETREDRLQHLF
ncbi:MAG: hypothetical protein CYPHOPRED_004459 [Cyphobasidiales sp. Tagirdzhanova-0007]|nr:MAG: hypothetical protein CYPHOPRED_004459 [Cyphobasidiales sp. Tagirdzhanova-0007]